MVLIQDVRLTDITLKAWRTFLTAAKNSRKNYSTRHTKICEKLCFELTGLWRALFLDKTAKTSFEELNLNLPAELECLRPDLVLCGNNIVIILAFFWEFFQGWAKSIVMQISFVMLLFSDQILGKGKSFQGEGAPCPPCGRKPALQMWLVLMICTQTSFASLRLKNMPIWLTLYQELTIVYSCR